LKHFSELEAKYKQDKRT